MEFWRKNKKYKAQRSQAMPKGLSRSPRRGSSAGQVKSISAGSSRRPGAEDEVEVAEDSEQEREERRRGTRGARGRKRGRKPRGGDGDYDMDGSDEEEDKRKRKKVEKETTKGKGKQSNGKAERESDEDEQEAITVLTNLQPYMKVKDWDTLIDKVDTVEADEDEGLVVYFRL